MKRSILFLLFSILVTITNGQVKLNDNGLYADAKGKLYTGVLELDENGVRTAVLEIKNGQLHGEAKYYFETGQLMRTGTHENGLKNGKWITYNENGLMVGLAFYNAGKKDGTWIAWDDNGKKRFEMNYKNDQKVGTWIQWDENGALFSSKNFSSVNQ
jgi:antitoxin component YwqK of YwqJK toxin-antitoxin module